MVDQIMKLLEASPFLPFTVVTTAGKSYPVPTAEHAKISPSGKMILVWLDGDVSVLIPRIQVASVEAKEAA
ncbi:MAG: hypothetical protein AAF236_09070 [Verrucomicrobiota bacterium]